MGNLAGAGKYMLFTPLTVVGFISMYIFGSFSLSVLVSLPHLVTGDFVMALITYFMSEALPPTSVIEVFLQAGIGTFIAGIKWFIAMSL